MSAKENLMRFGVLPDKADIIITQYEDDRLNDWLKNESILIVISTMIEKGWLEGIK